MADGRRQTAERRSKANPACNRSGARDLERAAVREWFVRFDDQSFSLTDAVSFAVMAERGATEAPALDRLFGAAGYRTVPAMRTA